MQAERVVAGVPGLEEAERKAQAARAAAEKVRNKAGALESEVNHLDDVAKEAEREAQAKLEAFRSAQGTSIYPFYLSMFKKL